MVPLTGCVHRIGVSIDSLIHVVVSREKAGSNPIPSPRKQDDGVHSPYSARSVDRRKAADSNSTIAELIVSNPGLKEFIDRDDKLRELTSAISDTTNFCDFKHLQQMIVQKVEHSIGNQLQFDQSSVFICVPPYP